MGSEACLTRCRGYGFKSEVSVVRAAQLFLGIDRIIAHADSAENLSA